jgi:hypothetical protein
VWYVDSEEPGDVPCAQTDPSIIDVASVVHFISQSDAAAAGGYKSLDRLVFANQETVLDLRDVLDGTLCYSDSNSERQQSILSTAAKPLSSCGRTRRSLPCMST